MMRRLLILLILVAALWAQQQATFPVLVTIGHGLKIVNGELGVLRTKTCVKQLVAQQQTFTTGPSPAVYRNGLRQAEGIDYTINAGGTVTFIHPTAVGDVIIFEYMEP